MRWRRRQRRSAGMRERDREERSGRKGRRVCCVRGCSGSQESRRSLSQCIRQTCAPEKRERENTSLLPSSLTRDAKLSVESSAPLPCNSLNPRSPLSLPLLPFLDQEIKNLPFPFVFPSLPSSRLAIASLDRLSLVCACVAGLAASLSPSHSPLAFP